MRLRRCCHPPRSRTLVPACRADTKLAMALQVLPDPQKTKLQLNFPKVHRTWKLYGHWNFRKYDRARNLDVAVSSGREVSRSTPAVNAGGQLRRSTQALISGNSETRNSGGQSWRLGLLTDTYGRVRVKFVYDSGPSLVSIWAVSSQIWPKLADSKWAPRVWPAGPTDRLPDRPPTADRPPHPDRPTPTAPDRPSARPSLRSGRPAAGSPDRRASAPRFGSGTSGWPMASGAAAMSWRSSPKRRARR